VLARTDTARLVALVDQTQTTNPASWPALTSLAPFTDWTRTHSCGVADLGFGFFEELGFGLGVAELVGLADVVELGVGVVVSGVDDPALEGEDVPAEVDAVALDEGLSLAELLDDADALAEAALLVLADLAGVAEDLADLNADAEELASAAFGSWSAALFLAPESTVLVGMSGHAALMLE
jgi:hypothetical protein